MKKTIFGALVLLAAVFAGQTSVGSRQQRPSPPNVLLIQADDLGYGDLSAYGQARFATPSLDRLAREGIRFTEYYAGTTVCAPSRTTLMTGLHTGHAWIRGNGDIPLRAEDVTIAEVLRDAGYRTAVIGKWGLGSPGTTGMPDRQGFDHAFGFLDHRHAHRQYTDHLWRNGERAATDLERDYVNDLFTKETTEFIQRSDARPFFVYLNYTVPHAELRAPEDSMSTMRGRFPEQSFENPKADATPAGASPELPTLGYRSQPEPHAAFAAMITRMDRDIGQLADLLRSRGIDRNTLMMFISDNGPHQEGGGDPVFFKSAGPLRGIKRDLYEGGIRVPMIASWPGTIPAARVSNHPWAHWDMLPTLADIAGARTPSAIDGVSMARALRGQEQTAHEFLYWEFHERGFQQAVRMGQWKAIRLKKDAPLELYNLTADPGEKSDVAATNPRVVTRIEEVLEERENGVGPLAGKVMPTRRDFLIGAASLATAALAERASAAQVRPGQTWDSGDVVHLLPAASHERFLIKASFRVPQREPPVLLAGSRKFPGRAGDTLGFFWTFDAAGLEPGRPYTLQILEARGRALCAPWQLSTFPSPGDSPKSVRLLIYSCAGGHDVLPDHRPTDVSTHRFLTLAVRRRMLERAMSFAPDAVVANGDHIYWDLRTERADLLGASPAAKAHAGVFNRAERVLGTANEQVLKKAVGPQIAELYGTTMRSTPVFFLQDDHDYFENDEADEKLVTFPPDAFMLDLARASQSLYYPEFLPDAHRSGLPSTSSADRPAGISESFGTLRYGKLLELLMYDCRRYMTLTGSGATFIPPVVEQWLKGRMAGSDATHVVNMPSTPPGWSAGKWGEWYADMDNGNQGLTTKIPKAYWQSGWRLQHDRLLRSASEMRGRIPLFVSGDLHALGEARILETSGINLRSNPVITVLPGPVGTGRPGWASLVRGLRAIPPAGLEVEEGLPTLEENGFTIADFTPERVTLRYFRWSLGQAEAALDTLEPFRVTNLVARG